MAIAKFLDVAEGAIDIGRELVPLTRGQARALDKVITATAPIRRKVRNWSLSKPQGKYMVKSSVGSIQHLPGAPVSIGSRINNARPVFRTVGNKVVISNREVVGYVDQSTASVRAFGNINPTNPYMFSWLSSMAASYDKFKFLNLCVHYVPTCATTAVGQVTLAYDPAGSDAAPDVIDLPLMHSVQVAPWMPADLTIPISKVTKYMGEAAGSAGIGKDFYSEGSIFVGTNGSSAAGILYVSYTVELHNPQPTSGLSTILQINGQVTGTDNTGYTALDGFDPLSNLPNELLVPAGTWKLEVIYVGTGLSNPVYTNGSGVNINTGTNRDAVSGTVIIQSGFLRSFGSLGSTLKFKVTFTTLTLAQCRLVRVDPSAFTTSVQFI